MKYAVLTLAILVFLVACQPPQAMPAAQPAPNVTENVSVEAPPAPEPQAAPAPAAQPHAEPPATQPFAKVNSTLQACLQLEQHLNETIDDAQTVVNHRKKDYDRAVQKYDAALDAPIPDEARKTELRDAQDTTEDAYNDAQDNYDDAVKKRAKARQQCGLPDE
jgi:hypothetical protein